jgi:dolichol kinase
MEPHYQNMLACLATLVYVKVVVGVCEMGVTRGWLASDLSRKIVHVAAGSWCLFWPFFTTAHWTWQLNVAIPTVYSIQLTVKGLLQQDPNDPDVKTMSRSGRPIELCQGPLLFTLVMIYCGLYQFRTDLGIYIMAALGYGDGIAPLVGKRYPYLP